MFQYAHLLIYRLLGYFMALFEMNRLYSIEFDQEMTMKKEQVRICQDAVMSYLGYHRDIFFRNLKNMTENLGP